MSRASTLHVEGNKVKNSSGEVVRLLGVNRAGLEWAASDEQIINSVICACDEWKSNIIRLPVSQDRWFGFGSDQASNDTLGEKYRTLVDEVIETVCSRGKYVILDLHWNSINSWGQNIGQHPMPDMNSVLFWRDAARRYINHPAVLFGLYNEPHSVSWDIWRDGGEVIENLHDRMTGTETTCTYLTSGLQALADAIREEGAQNILIVGGLDWGFWLDGVAGGYTIDDKGGNGVIYDSHIYPWKPLDWDIYVTCVADRFPLLIGEFGHYGDQAKPREGMQSLPSAEWMMRILDWIELHQYHFTAWDFHPSAGPCLIQNFNNEPTEYFGVYVKEYLAKHGK